MDVFLGPSFLEDQTTVNLRSYLPCPVIHSQQGRWTINPFKSLRARQEPRTTIAQTLSLKQGLLCWCHGPGHSRGWFYPTTLVLCSWFPASGSRQLAVRNRGSCQEHCFTSPEGRYNTFAELGPRNVTAENLEHEIGQTASRLFSVPGPVPGGDCHVPTS